MIGMTDKQFKTMMRLILDTLKEIKEEKDENKKEERLNKVIDIVKNSIED